MKMLNEASRFVDINSDSIHIESYEKLAIKPPQELLDQINDGFLFNEHNQFNFIF